MNQLYQFADDACAELDEGAAVQAVPVARHKTIDIDGVNIFYREAGPAGAPVLLLLHGFPTSSHMFRNLIPRLADNYHVIAPDYPGFGHSDAPAPTAFAYTFDHLATLVDKLTVALGVTKFSMYVMDYGAPIGYRLALRQPERIQALIIQNGNAYDEGLDTPFWDPIKAYWADPSQANRNALDGLITRKMTEFQYTHGMSDRTHVSPDTWLMDQALLDRPGNREIQLDLFRDYATNVALYPAFQAFFRRHRPPTLIVWGKNDLVFPEAGARPYLRDLPRAELHILDTGHYALEDKFAVMVSLIRNFLARKLGDRYLAVA